MADEPKEVAEVRARGARLQSTVNSSGWSDVLDILESLVAEAEFHLMNYNGSDAATVFALQKRARSMREMFERAQHQIQATIEAAAVAQPSSPAEVGHPGTEW